MRSDDDPLSPVWESYLLINACFTVTKRVMKESDGPTGKIDPVFKGTYLSGTIESEIPETFDFGQQTVDDVVILSLYATFERRLIEFLQERGNAFTGERPEWLAIQLHLFYENQIERIQIQQVLSWLKNQQVIDETCCKDIIKVKDYRDWIAHRNPKSKSEVIPDPETVYDILSTALEKIDSALHI
jgi:hypothetical protein